MIAPGISIKLNAAACIGCNACAVHCATNKNLPHGIFLCKVTYKKQSPDPLNHLLVFKYNGCYHCKRPRCLAACPEGAIIKRPEDGIVYIEMALCKGCGKCSGACTWNVPKIDYKTAKAYKCNLCLDRLSSGLKPACVTGCTTGALELHVQQVK